MNKNNINFIFWGTPDVASETLEKLKQEGYLPSLIVTSPDARSGRGLIMNPSPVAKFAEQNNIPCLKPEKLDSEIINTLKATGYELAIVVAYGKILPAEILNIPKLGSFNVHYSLLPKYRGASPVETAILNGDKETGVTIQKMVYEMDAGDIVARESTPIGDTETAPELRSRLIEIGSKLLIQTLPKIIDKKLKPVPQNPTEVTFCKKIKKEDGLIKLSDNPILNFNKFRAYKHWPRIFFIDNSSGINKRVIITDAKLENDKFVIHKVIPEGGKEMTYNPRPY